MTRLKAGPFKGMYTTLHDEAPMDMAHYAVNLLPRNTEYIQRPPVRVLTSPTLNASTIQCAGTRLSDTTYQTWVLTSEPAIYEVSLTAGTITAKVTAANFTTAGITATSSGFWTEFSDEIVFAESGGVPWSWDGTAGVGSLTALTNAGNVATNTAPTVYYGKLFFIKAGHGTVVWSEENAANTGYEAGGYNNAWQLAQSSTHPLRWLLGTNVGLYYFRDTSIGLIRGAVTPDFSTTGVHDEVSTTVGAKTPTAPYSSAVLAGNKIWFAAAPYGAYYIPLGGTPVRADVIDDSIDEEDFGYNEPFGFTSEFTGWKQPRFLGCMHIPVIGHYHKNMMVFMPNGYVNDEVSSLAFNCDSGNVLGWMRFYHGTGAKGLYGNVRGYGYVSNDRGAAILGDHAASTKLFTWGMDDGGRIDSGPDQNAAGTLQSTVYRLIGPTIGYNPKGHTAWHFDKFRCKVFGEGTVTGTAQYLTSEKSYQDEVDAAQSWTTTHDASHRNARVFELGIDENGRWLRPVIAVSSNSIDKFGIGDMSVEVFPQPIEEFER